MFATLLNHIGGSPQSSARAGIPRASPDSVASVITVEDSLSNAQSSSSTPPTSIGDDASIASSSLKDAPASPHSRREPTRHSRRDRASVGTYNVKVLTGTAIHAPRKYAKNVKEPSDALRRRTISGDTLVEGLDTANSSSVTLEKDAKQLVSAGIDALDLEWSVKKLSKSRSQRSLGGSPRKNNLAKHNTARQEAAAARSKSDTIVKFSKQLSALGKRKFESGKEKMDKASRELRKLADTPEFAKIDTKPVVHEIWSNGKLVVEEPARKKRKMEAAAAAAAAKPSTTETKEPTPKIKNAGKKEKVWLQKGLYAGQKGNLDWNQDAKAKVKANMAEVAPFRPKGILPMPMWHGQRLLQQGRDFKLPFDVCSPLPPGQSKPEDWKKTSSNRFIGEAAALWKKSILFDSFLSKCVCTPKGGCDVDCFNKIMLYECDDTNCGAGRDRCQNRPFADLVERRKAGGKYRIGVEVMKTADRGYGVRSNRCFEANQIIVEYMGEIITEDECDRRMNEDYKDNDCYYLMSFDQNMIIDATKGSIARFVNHSCKPNCRMVKWIVGGKPRMALFAGNAPIMTGEELTYDYNFDPFSAKNVQECRCGSDNCRGILGPRPKDQKPIKDLIKDTAKATVKAGKRKLKELFGAGGDEDSDAPSPKKRKMKSPKSLKKKVSTAKLMVKGAKAISNKLSKAMGSKKALSVVKTTKTKRSISYSPRKKQSKEASRSSSMTVVEKSNSPRSMKKGSAAKKQGESTFQRGRAQEKEGVVTRGRRNSSTIRVVS